MNPIEELSKAVELLDEVRTGNYDLEAIIVSLSIDRDSYKDIANSQMQIIENITVTLADKQKMYAQSELRIKELLCKTIPFLQQFNSLSTAEDQYIQNLLTEIEEVLND